MGGTHSSETSRKRRTRVGSTLKGNVGEIRRSTLDIGFNNTGHNISIGYSGTPVIKWPDMRYNQL